MNDSSKRSIELNQTSIDWSLDEGRMSFFGIPAVTFWLAPSLLRMLRPLREEVGGDLYRLIVAYQASLGTEEDYHQIVTLLGETFEEGFVAWGAAVSVAGWGHFEIQSFDPIQQKAVVLVKNPWELQMLESVPDESSWGCPFLLGKIIGIFKHALNTNCWADEKNICMEHGASSVELHIYAHELTIEQELQELRNLHKRERERELELEIAARIQERIQAEEAVRASELKFRTLVETINAAIFIYSGEVLLFVNPMTTELTGYSEAELHKKVFSSILHPEDQRVIMERALVHQSGTRIPPHEARIVRKDGAIRWLSFDASPLEFAGEAALLGVAFDITERKAADAKRAQLQRQVEHTQRLESLGVLAGGIAHDFNNILMAIMGNAALAMGEHRPSPSAVRSHLSRIVQSSEKAALLCRQMLAYSGKGQYVIEPLNLCQQVADVTALLEVSIHRDVKLDYRLDEGLPLIAGDESQLQQVIMNLVINASDAISESIGTISLTTGVMEADVQYLAEAVVGNELEAGRYVFLEVRDSGCGMDAATVRQIFEPFFTTKFTGRGLGMSAVLGIVRGHGGAIRIESEPGLGSSFQVLFPALPEDQVLAANAEGGLLENSRRGSGSVLVIDDEESVNEAAVMILESIGFSTLAAHDGSQGIELYAAHREEIVAVLLDMTMPGLDGRACFQQLRKMNGELVVVLMSGYTERKATSGFSGEGLAGFIQKPFLPADLEKVMLRALNPQGTESS